jgi:hypothetical protein
MITDAWNGRGAYRSDDLVTWTAQPNNLLQQPGILPTERTIGHHCDVIVNDGRAFIYYFTHQGGPDEDPVIPHSASRTVLQVAELQLKDGQISIDRDQLVHVNLGSK